VPGTDRWAEGEKRCDETDSDAAGGLSLGRKGSVGGRGLVTTDCSE
jgi:hypothetical protein